MNRANKQVYSQVPTMYICELEKPLQEDIEVFARQKFIADYPNEIEEIVENIMDSRVCSIVDGDSITNEEILSILNNGLK